MAAAPAAVIAGALAVTPSAGAAVRIPAPAAAPAAWYPRAVPDRDWRPYSAPVAPEPAVTAALVTQHDPAWRYTVRPGDTLSAIALRFYGSAAAWPRIRDANRAAIPDPGLIRAGQLLSIPAAGSASAVPAAAAAVTAVPLSGTLSCAGLEQLWEEAGGPAGEAFMAAEIAMAESGGRQSAVSPTDDVGYWQVNSSHGPAEATTAPLGNARAAVAISAGGTDWEPWTTFRTGAYQGRC